MATAPKHDLDRIDVTDRKHWEHGPPHALFTAPREECPVHWSEINEYENEAGFCSITRADNVRDVSQAGVLDGVADHRDESRYRWSGSGRRGARS